MDNIIDLLGKSRAEGFGEEVQRRIMIGTYALSLNGRFLVIRMLPRS